MLFYVPYAAAALAQTCMICFGSHPRISESPLTTKCTFELDDLELPARLSTNLSDGIPKDQSEMSADYGPSFIAIGLCWTLKNERMMMGLSSYLVLRLR